MDEGAGEQDVHQDSAAVSWHESSLGSSVFLDDALLLTVSRTWDKIGFVDFPEGRISLLTGDGLQIGTHQSCGQGSLVEPFQSKAGSAGVTSRARNTPSSAFPAAAPGTNSLI